MDRFLLEEKRKDKESVERREIKGYMGAKELSVVLLVPTFFFHLPGEAIA